MSIDSPASTGNGNSLSSGRAGERITLAGVLVNLVLIIIKLLAGFLGHSQALIADALHSISDLFTDAVVLAGLKIGRKPADEDHPFGHARFETLASTIVGFILVALAIYIGFDSAHKIYHHEDYQPAPITVAAAALSILMKEVLYRFTIKIGRAIKSNAVIANAWHHRSDALSSIAVLFGVGAAQLNHQWHILDSYAALLVSILILKVGYDIGREAVMELTDTSPDKKMLDRMKHCALHVSGVMNVHDLKARKLGGQLQMELHIVVNGDQTVTAGHRIAKEVESCLLEEIKELERVIIHVDPA